VLRKTDNKRKMNANQKRKAARNNRVRIARGQAPPLPPRTQTESVLLAQGAPARRRPPRNRNRGGAGGAGSLGAKVGAFLGGGAQKLFKMVTGFGDYQVQGNSLVAGTSPPVVRNTPGGMVIRHREYITDVFATQTFVNTQYNINPGLNGTFPWLANVALAFEEYKFHGLIFEFKSMSADNVLSTTTTSTALGSVIMATQYNALDNPFGDKRNMENYEFACSAKPSASFVHPIECQSNLDANTHLYIRQGAFVGDQRLYDLGNFQVAVQGMAFTGGVIGELWATYEIEFFKPKIVNGLLSASDHIQLSGVSSVNPLGSSNTRVHTGINGAIGGQSYVFPLNTVGRFLVTYSCVGTVQALTAPALTFTNCTVIANTFQNGTVSVVSNTGSTAANFLQEFTVQVTPSGFTSSAGFSQIAWGSAGSLPTGAIGDLFVVQMDSLNLAGF
jgi:hypothetical protein